MTTTPDSPPPEPIDTRVRVTVDDRVRVEGPRLPWALIDALKAAFTHVNPAHAAQARLGFKPTEPPLHRTWTELPPAEPGWRPGIAVPRGGMSRVRAAIEACGVARDVVDARVAGTPLAEGERLVHRVRLYPHQEALVAGALARENCILRAPTGCLTGDTFVTINRAGKGARMRLDHVVKMFHGGIAYGKRWAPEIPTMVRAPMPDGTVRLRRVLGATESGVRPVYRLTLSNGARLCATLCHRFLTPFGWVPLEALNVGDVLFQEGAVGGNNPPRRAKPWYQLRRCKHHPYASRRGVNPAKGGWTVPVHRLVAEARENGMTLDAFLEAVEEKRPGLRFLDPGVFAVHHLDHNPHHNAPENLVMMTHEEHAALHAKDAASYLATRLLPVFIESIEYAGDHPTYDLEVEEAEAFIANGIAVHNSGKTCIGFALAARVGVWTLVVVSTRALFDQWVARAQKELGLRRDEIGVIAGGETRLRPLTIAIQKSLHVRGVSPEMKQRFGLLLCDEVHLFSARTFLETTEPFPARYRIGVSADHTRKDGKEYLLHDVFGQVEVDVPREAMVAQGRVLDVDVLVVPTDFASPHQYSRALDRRTRVLRDMFDDDARMDVLLRTILAEAPGEQVLVMTHHRDACRVIDQRLAAYGIRTGFLIGGADFRREFNETRARFEAGDVRVAVGTFQSIGYGIDLPKASVVVCATPIGTNKQLFGQVRGRVCRVAQGKASARLYYLWDRRMYGRRVLENLVAWNRVVRLREGNQWVDASALAGPVRRTA